MRFSQMVKILKKEFLWIFPRAVLLAGGSVLLYLLLNLGYLTSDLYSLSFRIWLVAYFIFGAAAIRRYLIKSIRTLMFKLGTHYIQEPGERIRLRRSTYTYSRIFEYAIYILAVLAAINLFFNLQAVWTAIGTTIFLVITFFIGLMTSSVLGNLVAYEAIRQTDAFSLDDVLETKDNTYGVVVSKGAFFTKIKTTKNEIVSIPNLELVNNAFKNYSKENPVILHVPVSLGYDVQKKTAKNLLIKAAKKTVGVLAEPSPFVLFLELGNYSITYEINAYSDQPQNLINIRSHLIENIIDLFEKNKIEILSPQYTVFRHSDSRLQLLFNR